MKTIIAGSRSITRHGLVRAAIVASGWADRITEVVSGGARGVDRVGEVWAREKGVPVQQFPADWRTHGKAAGPLRNEQMAVYADALIAVWDGISRGTADMIDRARRHDLDIYVHKQEAGPMQVAPLPPITAAERAAMSALVCRDCGAPFTSTDPDRKYCDVHLCERINGAGILEDDDDDEELFTAHTLVCGGCGVTFTSPRRVARCAECNAGVKALVVCRGCGAETHIPALQDVKLCGPCRADLVMTTMVLESTLNYAQCHADEAWLKLEATLSAADASDRARYDAACEKAQEWTQARWQAARDAAIAKGDGLSPLLSARAAWDDAAAELDRVRATVAAGLAEVERAR